MEDADHRATPLREVREKLSEWCPGVSERAKRSSWGLKAVLLLLHVVFVGTVFVLDPTLVRRTREEPWYTAAYLVLLLVTLVQYILTSVSSPGFDGALVADSASFDREYSVIAKDWTCPYCNVIQPPRSKHCHDCDKCVLQFDHHCVWLGTCIGLKNHCRFWWYIFEETILSVWTVVLYISFLRSDIEKEWWEDFIGIILLAGLMFCLVFLLLLLLFHSYLALTNQTTYELARRKRILYLRGVPDRVHPFSKGICRNLYAYCCSRDKFYILEEVPPMEELQARARPYTWREIISCRCS